MNAQLKLAKMVDFGLRRFYGCLEQHYSCELSKNFYFDHLFLGISFKLTEIAIYINI